MHYSAVVAPSLSWDGAAIRALTPPHPRKYVERESFAWQNLSQHGLTAEHYALASRMNRRDTVNGRTRSVPNRPRRRAAPNRLLEAHGVAGAIGEQLGLAWTAEQDVQRIAQTSERRIPEHQRLIQRALAEMSAYFLLGASHSLTNLVLRLLLLNPAAEAALTAKYTKANGFPVFSDDRSAWISLNHDNLQRIGPAAAASGNRFRIDAPDDAETNPGGGHHVPRLTGRGMANGPPRSVGAGRCRSWTG